jgi:4-amino-4-deoxy-L-arabinose transferase-like glycosyltransferase
MSPRISRFTFYIFLSLLAIGAALTLYAATPAGIGLTNDSAAYIGGARSILNGTGYSDIWLDTAIEPITHYPPLLSLTLALIGRLGLDPLRGARLLNILLFGANTALIGLLGWRMTRSQIWGIFLAVLFGLSAAVLQIHAFALSEPLFLFLSLSSLILFDLSFEKKEERRKNASFLFLLSSGLLAGLTCLTRYSGLALIATILLSVFLLLPDWRSRFTKAIYFLVGAVPPIAAWFIRNALVAETATNRTFQWHPVTMENIARGIYNFSQFIMPIESIRREMMKSGAVAWILFGLGLALLAWLIIQAFRLILRRDVSISPLIFTNAVYIFGYLGAVLFSMSFFDASTKFQIRILAPLYVSWMILFVAVVEKFLNTKARLWRTLAIISIAIAISLSAYGFQSTVSELRNSAGLGYGSWKWRDSLVMQSLRNLPEDRIIYTNTPPAVYLVTGRACRTIPTPLDPVDNLPRGEYDQDVAQMRADILSGRAVLALFDLSDMDEASGLGDLEALTSGLALIQKAQGDVLYGRP